MQLPSKVYPVALLDRERSAALPNWPALNSPCGYTQLPIRDSESAYCENCRRKMSQWAAKDRVEVPHHGVSGRDRRAARPLGLPTPSSHSQSTHGGNDMSERRWSGGIAYANRPFSALLGPELILLKLLPWSTNQSIRGPRITSVALWGISKWACYYNSSPLRPHVWASGAPPLQPSS
jgi:hypothetical protein